MRDDPAEDDGTEERAVRVTCCLQHHKHYEFETVLEHHQGVHARYAGEAVRQSLLPVGTLSLLLLPTTVIAVAFGQSLFAYGFFNWPVIPAVVALSVWNLLPIAGMATLVVQTTRRWPRGLPAARVGVVVLSVVTAYGYWWLLLGPGRESTSWHSGLLSVILPGYLWIVVASTAGITFVLHKRGRVRSSQR